MSFRIKLINFGLLLAFLAAIPGTLILVQSPWDELRNLIKQSNQVLASVEVYIPREHIQAMGEFALEMSELIPDKLPALPDTLNSDDDYYYPRHAVSQAFNWAILYDYQPTETELITKLNQAEYTSIDFEYSQFLTWLQFWNQELASRPGLREIFQQHKKQLAAAARKSSEIGIQIADLYIMIDRGQQNAGFFKENIAFVLESLPWWDSVYPGQAFNLVKTSTLNWRESYDLQNGGHLGFHHSEIAAPENWFLPQFDKDRWGTWFTVWYAPAPLRIEDELLYTTYNIDFSADKIVQMMTQIGLSLLIAATVLMVFILFFTRAIAAKMAKPIADITKGAEAVMQQKYDHRVPQSKQGEFNTLITVFNHMIEWVKQMTNLKDTLSKLTSAELAEIAANQGLVLGGQTAHCSILFTDFAGFTDITQKMTPTGAVNKLNFYFSELMPIIKKWGGFPDKYIGDAIVVIFGAPVPLVNHAERATRCAIEMQNKMREINRKLRAEKKVHFEMRIGINTGTVMVGAIGCDIKLEYTAIGETTNLANRIESGCEIGQVLISANTFVELNKEDDELMQKIAHPIQLVAKGYASKITAYPIRIDTQRIEKNPDAINPVNFYIVSEIESSAIADVET